MTEHLFRPMYVNPVTQDQKFRSEQAASFLKTDEKLSQHFDVHVVTLSSKVKRLATNGRDTMTQWGDTIFVKPQLTSDSLSSIFLGSPFTKMLNSLGYPGKVGVNPVMAEGGAQVYSDEFILISDAYKQWEKLFNRANKRQLPIYYVPSHTSTAFGHIDGDYQPLDMARVLYASRNVFQKDNLETRRAIGKIADKHEFELREYKLNPSDEPKAEIMTAAWMRQASKQAFGINFLINNALKVLATGSIHPQEKEFLKAKGVKVVVPPLGNTDIGAGIRCVYGQFSLT